MKKELRDAILEYSVSCNLKEAIQEWDIESVDNNLCKDSQCICGHKNIRFEYKLKNRINKNIMFPVGSVCIREFNRSDFKERSQVYETLLTSISDGFIQLSTLKEKFNRKTLMFLYDSGAFDIGVSLRQGWMDYKFILRLFNRRSSDAISDKALDRYTMIMNNRILPWIKEHNGHIEGWPEHRGPYRYTEEDFREIEDEMMKAVNEIHWKDF